MLIKEKIFNKNSVTFLTQNYIISILKTITKDN